MRIHPANLIPLMHSLDKNKTPARPYYSQKHIMILYSKHGRALINRACIPDGRQCLLNSNPFQRRQCAQIGALHNTPGKDLGWTCYKTVGWINYAMYAMIFNKSHARTSFEASAWSSDRCTWEFWWEEFHEWIISEELVVSQVAHILLHT